MREYSKAPNLARTILSNYADIQKITELATYTNISKLLSLLKPLLSEESLYVVLPKSFADVGIVGDIHGSYSTTKNVVAHFLNSKLATLVFLGDYVDRGLQSIETLCLLFALKLAFPKEVILLRGNHETKKINKHYGFEKEIRNKSLYSDDECTILYKEFNTLFSYLSLAAQTPQKSLCIHGGVPSYLSTLTDLNATFKPLTFHDSSQSAIAAIAEQILWNDPVEKQKADFTESYRGTGKLFNKNAVIKFLKTNGLQRIIRAHEASRGAYQFLFNNRLIHIFTSEPYFGKIPVGMFVHETPTATIIRNLRFEEVDRIK